MLGATSIAHVSESLSLSILWLADIPEALIALKLSLSEKEIERVREGTSSLHVSRLKLKSTTETVP